MSDENTTINSGVNGRTIYNVVVSAGKTYIINAVTGRAEFVVNGEFTPGGDSAVATSLTTTERTAITPDAGVLIWDTDLEKLFIGDGSTAGGVEVQGGGGSGTVTGIEASVDGGTATITATGSTTSVKLTGTGGVDVKGNTTTGAVELDAKDLSDGTQSVSKDVKQARFVEYVTYATAATQNALTLLHFSDIHADSAALARIVAAGDALGSLVNDMICTGDLVQNYATGSIASWWNSKVMTVIGNHDSADSSYNWNGTSMANRDAYYIAPFESNWGITHTSGTSYYYKDYSTQKVRLIVLDAMLYMSDSMATEAAAQTSWLEGLLASAITGNLHVVIALHAPKLFSPVVPCSFSKYGASIVDTTATMCTISDTIINAVASAKANGLKFVGYICGHTHQDYINDILGDGSQYAYCVTCAAVAQTVQWMPYSDIFRDATLDAFNLVTIDTAHTTVAIVRGGGANIDEELRPRETISINYGTGEVIDREITKMQDGFRAEFKNGVVSVARYIDTDVVTGSNVTLQAGHAYKFTASGTITLNMESSPMDSYGLEGMLDVTLSGGTVVAGDGIVFADTLSSGRNICSVHYLDGTAVINVLTVISDTPVSGYIVVSATGTADGSLYYGLSGSTESEVYVSSTLNGQTLDLGGAVTNGAKVVTGNGYGYTTISGGVSCTDETTFSRVSLDSVSILGGTMTLDGADIPSENSVYISSGYIKPLNVQGSGVIDESTITSGTSYVWPAAPVMAVGKTVNMTDVTISGTTGCRAMFTSNCQVNMTSCTITGAYAWVTGQTTTYDAGYAQGGGTATITGCTFSNNSNSATTGIGAGIHLHESATGVFESCTISDNYVMGAFNAATNAGDGGGGICINTTGVSGCVFSSCLITGNTANHIGGGVFLNGEGDPVLFKECMFTSNRAPRGGGLTVTRGAKAVLSGCTFTKHDVASTFQIIGVMATPAIAGQSRTPELYMQDTIISGNSGVNLDYPVFIQGGICYVSGTTIGYNYATTSRQWDVTGSGSMFIEGGCLMGMGRINNGGRVFIGGTNQMVSVDNTAGDADITISSGASITLLQSINVGASKITVLTGGCTVNGASIPAGTYTTIVSSGGSAVAS